MKHDVSRLPALTPESLRGARPPGPVRFSLHRCAGTDASRPLMTRTARLRASRRTPELAARTGGPTCRS